MDNLIEALTILRKYENPACPTHCSHGKLWVNVSPAEVTPEDLARLKELAFHVDSEAEGFYSFFFGSC
jgi:hypothetical protein